MAGVGVKQRPPPGLTVCETPEQAQGVHKQQHRPTEFNSDNEKADGGPLDAHSPQTKAPPTEDILRIKLYGLEVNRATPSWVLPSFRRF